VIRPHRNKVSDEWLIYYLNATDLSSHITGMTVPKLNQEKMRDIAIPVPPLPEQQRMVKVLDEAFAGIATATENAKKNLQNARELFESHLQSIFTNKGDGWVEKRLSEVSEIFAGGDVPKHDWSKSANEKHKIPIYTNGETNRGLYGYTTTARVVHPSVTISARGTLGYTAIRREPFYPAIRLIVVTPSDIVDLGFLFYALQRMNFGNSGTSIPQLTVPMVRHC
jgi:type I restriction enzyme S subunit